MPQPFNPAIAGLQSQKPWEPESDPLGIGLSQAANQHYWGDTFHNIQADNGIGGGGPLAAATNIKSPAMGGLWGDQWMEAVHQAAGDATPGDKTPTLKFGQAHGGAAQPPQTMAGLPPSNQLGTAVSGLKKAVWGGA